MCEALCVDEIGEPDRDDLALGRYAQHNQCHAIGKATRAYPETHVRTECCIIKTCI
jgi:hypothetical protein